MGHFRISSRISIVFKRYYITLNSIPPALCFPASHHPVRNFLYDSYDSGSGIRSRSLPGVCRNWQPLLRDPTASVDSGGPQGPADQHNSGGPLVDTWQRQHGGRGRDGLSEQRDRGRPGCQKEHDHLRGWVDQGGRYLPVCQRNCTADPNPPARNFKEVYDTLAR